METIKEKSNLQKGIVDEINFVIEALINDDSFKHDDKVRALTEKDKFDIVNEMINDEGFMYLVKVNVDYYIKKKIGVDYYEK